MLLLVEKPLLVFVNVCAPVVPVPIPPVGVPSTPLELMGDEEPFTVGVVTPGPTDGMLEYGLGTNDEPLDLNDDGLDAPKELALLPNELLPVPEVPMALVGLATPPPKVLLLPIPVPRLADVPAPENELPLLAPEEPLPKLEAPAGPALAPMAVSAAPAPCKPLVSQSRLLGGLSAIIFPLNPTTPFAALGRSIVSLLCKGGVELSKEQPKNVQGKISNNRLLFMIKPYRRAALGQ